MRTYSVMADRAVTSINNSLSNIARSGAKAQSGKQMNAPSDNIAKYSVSRLNRTQYGNLQATNESLNSAARSIRSADSAMGTIDKILDNIINGTDIVKKEYPPFPAGSETRVERLRMINGLRKLIDKLAMPPNDSGAQKIMGNPQNQNAGGMVVRTTSSEFQFVIRAEVHTGQTGLNLPQLPEHATEEELSMFAEKAQQAKATLAERRFELQGSMKMVQRTFEMNVMFAESSESVYQEVSGSEDVENTVAMKSASIRLTLGTAVINGLTNNQEELATLWN